MNIFRPTVVAALVLGGLIVPAAPAAAQQTPQVAASLSPEPYLNADGTLNLPEGLSGSFDLSGWDVTLDGQRGPRFAPAGAAVTLGAWSSLGGPDPGLNGTVQTLLMYAGTLYAGGDFTNAGGDPNADYIAKFENGAWSSLGGPGTGLNGGVYDLVMKSGTLFAGGFFTNAGSDIHADFIAKYEGGAWSSLGGTGTGLNGNLYTLLMDGDTLYVGGTFADAGGDGDADRIAKFEGGAWSSVGGAGTGLNSSVLTLLMDGGTLYAGGNFSDAGGDGDADRIAKFEGGAWSSVGGVGLNNEVRALLMYGDTLVAGGGFTDAGGDGDADYIAKFEGGAWSSLGGPGTGLNFFVYSLVRDRGTLYAGGAFSNAGGDGDADYVAKFESGAWSSLGGPGTGLQSFVNALFIDSGILYAGGWFTDAGGDVDADRVAQYGLYEVETTTTEEEAVSEGCAVGASGGECKVGDVWVNVPAGALPGGQTGCRIVIDDAGAASGYGLSLNESVYDVRVVCENGAVTLFNLHITVCIRPADGVTSGKQLFHNHNGAGFSALPAAAGKTGHVCGTTSQLSLFVIGGQFLPDTGFAPGVVTPLAAQPEELAYASTDLVLSIPSLNVETAIVGVPQSADGWDVTWLGQDAGYLYGTAFPTWTGNTVLTGHVWDANNNPGPFADLADLQHGDTIEIHAFGQVYVYEVRATEALRPTDTRAFAHSDYDVLTLITCEGFSEASGDYLLRRVVTAVLVAVR